MKHNVYFGWDPGTEKYIKNLEKLDKLWNLINKYVSLLVHCNKCTLLMKRLIIGETVYTVLDFLNFSLNLKLF